MTKRDMLTPLVTLGENIVLLAFMLIGLRRYRVVGMHGLWGYVHRQVCYILSYGNLKGNGMSDRECCGSFLSSSRSSLRQCVSPTYRHLVGLFDSNDER